MVRDPETTRLLASSAGLVATAELLLGELEGHTVRLADFVEGLTERSPRNGPGLREPYPHGNGRSRPDVPHNPPTT